MTRRSLWKIREATMTSRSKIKIRPSIGMQEGTTWHERGSGGEMTRADLRVCVPRHNRRLVYLTRSFPVPSQKHGLWMRQSCYKAPPHCLPVRAAAWEVKGMAVGWLRASSGLGDTDSFVHAVGRTLGSIRWTHACILFGFVDLNTSLKIIIFHWHQTKGSRNIWNCFQREPGWHQYNYCGRCFANTST